MNPAKPEKIIFTRLYLIRHGQTEWNHQKHIQGQLDIPLNQTGLSQAQAIANKMTSQHKIDVLLSSPSSRAFATAEAIQTAVNKEIQVQDDLIEIDFGDLVDHSVEMLPVEFPKYVQAFSHFVATNHTEGTPRPPIPGGEIYENVRIRIQRFTDMILDQHAGKHIAAVSHGSFIKCMLAVYTKSSLHDFIPFWIENASLTIVDFIGRQPVIRVVNDVSHLETSLGFIVPKVM